MPEQDQWQTVPHDHPALPGHFPGHPVVPGVVLLSRVWDAVCDGTDQPLECTGWPNVKFLAPLLPDEPFRVVVEPATAESAKFACKTVERTIAQGSVRFVSRSAT